MNKTPEQMLQKIETGSIIYVSWHDDGYFLFSKGCCHDQRRECGTWCPRAIVDYKSEWADDVLVATCGYRWKGEQVKFREDNF